MGESNQGREIYTARVGEGDTVVFVESQIHGNENHGTEALLDLLRRWGGSTPEAVALREEVTIVAIPRLNVDGGERDTRQNEMTWADVVAAFPQLAGVAPAWNYNTRVGGFDVNRDFNPDLDYVPQPADFPGNSADTGWYITPESQTVRDVYRGLEAEFGTVDYFVDLHNQWSCYATEDLESMSPLSISAKFIEDPAEFGTWPKFDMEASERANVAVYEALQGNGKSGYGDVTLYPQDTNLPGTALGSFALRGSAVVLFETSSQTQYDGMKRNGMLRKQIEIGLGGLRRRRRRRLDRHARPVGLRHHPAAGLPARRLTGEGTPAGRGRRSVACHETLDQRGALSRSPSAGSGPRARAPWPPRAARGPGRARRTRGGRPGRGPG